MSWRECARRFHHNLGGALAAALATAALAAAPEVLAQEQILAQRSGQDAQARTALGMSPNAQRCAQSVVEGVVADIALRACNIAIERDRLSRSDLVATRVNRGIMLMRRNDSAGAIADFDAALAIDPDNAEVLSNRGTALLAGGQPGPAVAAITHALSIGVREPHKAYYNRGAAREALGDLAGAYDDYTTALRIKPDWGPAEAELARFVRSRQERLARIIGVGGGRAAPATQEEGRP